MAKDPSAQPVYRYRLRGQVDGLERSLPVVPSRCRVGSADSNDLVLRERGVSRQHAHLVEASGRWVLEDLGSKNGTFVNGRSIECEGVAVGDELGFGPLRFQFEAIDPDDAELAMELTALPEIADEPLAQETTLTSRLGSVPTSNALRWLEAFLGHLTVRPESDLEGALKLVAGAFESVGAGLVEWPRDGSPVALAAWGRMNEIPDAGAVLERLDEEPGKTVFLAEQGEVPVVCAVRSTPRRGAMGLLIWGGSAELSAWKSLLSTLVSLFHHFLPQNVDSLGASGRHGPVEDELRLPADIVRGESPVMVSLYQQMRLLLQGDVPVLIQGETGVGKEHLAHVLHASAPRSDRPFVAVNCAAIPSELLEAEMFGIGKGVATGVQPRAGKFVEAQGGVLFLDEIGAMPQALQAKLLRVLQEKEVQPLGRRDAVALDVRVITATNTDLVDQVEEGRFRQDLYYRIAGYVLEVPPLRRRQDDISRFVNHFTRRFCKETGKVVRGITVKALRILTDYTWPGNVRQLEHEVRRLVYLCPHGQAIDSRLVSEPIARPTPHAEKLRDDPGSDSLALEEHLQAVERRLIRRALARARGNQTRAAKMLKVSRNGLAKRLKRLGIEPFEAVAWEP